MIVTLTDDALTQFYEGNGLFAKIIDTPAEEALRRGFTLSDISDQKVKDFYGEALDKLDWEETAITAIKWTRLFGGALIVMLINDGRGLDEPLDWKNIKSIDDMRVYDRSVVQPDYQSMFQYDPRDPFSTRGSRLGMPEFYHVYSKYGNFTVHESRCLVFQNGTLSENSTNSIYQFWGLPEYIRIYKAIQNVEISHRSAPRMLDRSVQPIYKMKDLAAELATADGETKVLKRLEALDMVRGMMNSIAIDRTEEYMFSETEIEGISDLIASTYDLLAAVTSIPKSLLFGRQLDKQATPLSRSKDRTSLKIWHNYVDHIRMRILYNNLYYLLSIIFQAGVYSGEIEETPPINIEFNSLWSLSEPEKADAELKRAKAQLSKAKTAQTYISMQVLHPAEVRKHIGERFMDNIDSQKPKRVGK